MSACQDVILLLTEYRERVLPWNQRIRVGMHLRLCPECKQMLMDLEALPSILGRFEPSDPVELLPIGEVALAKALERLHETRSTRRLPLTPVPFVVQNLLSSVTDLPLRLLAQTHAAMMQGTAPRSLPFLPDEVLSQLPDMQDWKWRHVQGGIRRALLWAEGNGPSLSLLFMPPNYTLASHIHLGTESLLILDGELEQGDRCLTDGDWIHMEQGSSHAPCAFGRGCWCLVRDEGEVRYTGRFGWVKGLMTGT